MSVTSEPLQPPVSWSWGRLGVRSRAVLLTAAALVLALLVAVVGYAVGSHRSGTHVTRGYAYASPDQISAQSQGGSYDVPLDVQWRDATGTWHDGSRPACLPASSARLPVTFAWVPVTIHGVSWRTVVWVDCR